MTAFIALWSHLLAAILYGGLAIWQLRVWRGEPQSRPLITAFAVMAVWSIFMAMLGPYAFLSQMADSARHLTFLAFMYGLIDGASEDRRQRPVKIVYAAVAAVVALQIVLAGLLPQFGDEPAVVETLLATSRMLGLAVAAGALVLVHNVYGQAAPESRAQIRLPMIALAMMWVYDLHLYTAAYITRDPAADLYAMRGAVLAMLVPLFALGMRRTTRWKIHLSRAATFQSLSVLAILAYLILMMSASRALELAGGDWVRIAQVGLVFAMSVAAFVLLPSPRARSWLNVMMQKHFFEHRYDYRQEWLRFTATIGGGGADIEQRVVKALAELAGADMGLLLIRDDQDRMVPAAGWNWPHPPEGGEEAAEFVGFLEKTGHVVDFPRLRDGMLRTETREIPLPLSLAGLPGAWAGVPLIHDGRLVGLVAVGHPPARRPLDWEDYDLFRAAGQQAASYIAEGRTLEALAQARRFDEFNRRFAFIMHDIKNLVSQLSLVARNAERHADNPQFRADMIATLQSSVKKMNDLLARLAPGTRGIDTGPGRVVPVPLRRLIAGVVEGKRRLHPVTLSGDARLAAMADPGALEQAIAHIVQNAIDATASRDHVEIALAAEGDSVRIDIADRGAGMSAEFIRTRLFEPFASTKEGGFGVGAHEARALIEAMGGRIAVSSREGEGSRFTIRLPAAAASPARTEPLRMTA